MRSKAILFFACLIILACQNQYSAEEIINKSMSVHGEEVIDTAIIEFDFRNIHYKACHANGEFQYERWIKDSIHDVLNNEGFTRCIDGEEVELTDDKKSKYSNSINSVIYFALLPYKLDDPAVNSQLRGKVSIDGEDYYEIRITFDQEGGGSDYEDEFAYWINQKTFTINYLAYLYYTDDGGTRFRKAYNHRKINGILFADYENYEGPFPFEVTKLDSLYMADELALLSKIILENIEVK